MHLLLHFLIQTAKVEPWNPRITQEVILEGTFWDLRLLGTYPAELWKPRRIILHNLFGQLASRSGSIIRTEFLK